MEVFVFLEDVLLFWICMGLGGELFDRLADFGYFPENKARHVMRQILAGIAYCHAEEVAHRDLKVRPPFMKYIAFFHVYDIFVSSPKTSFS